MKLLKRVLAVAVTLVAIFDARAAAQESGSGTVTGTGQAVVKAQPDLLRVTIQLDGTGADVKEALAKLTQEKEAAKAKLAGLGVAAESVETGEAALGGDGAGGGGAGAAQMRAMAIAMAMRQGRKPGGGAAAPANAVTVSSTLQFELPLKGGTGDERLVEGVELTGKMKTAFARALSPEEQELVEEMQQSGRGQNMPRPGEPQFLFVHKLTDAERAKATADAFAEAKQSATRLAQAAGAKLGAVRQISESATPAGAAAQVYGQYAEYQGYSYAFARAASTGRGGSGEASSSQPGPVMMVVQVSAGFALH